MAPCLSSDFLFYPHSFFSAGDEASEHIACRA